ncbi:MAG: hypothetical protein A2017_11530 [Lentisphaerae bacterium GWF2_44_16]|nr:MAG: hypothetical protein A2017_11530 [Lentisphaerae bacterium GWF2_44_16]
MNPLIPIEYALILTALFVFIAVWMGWKSSGGAGTGKRLTITALRGATALLLMLIALNPGRWRQEDSGSEKRWAVMIDRSLSMDVKDEKGGMSRWEKAHTCLMKIDQFAGMPKDYYTFSAGLEEKLNSPEDMKKLKADGASTDITGTGEKLIDIYKAGRSGLAGMIIISDGHQIAPSKEGEFALRARAECMPVYAFVPGGKVPGKNISITASRRYYTAFIGETLSIQTFVKNTNMGNTGISLELSCNGRNPETKKLQIENNSTAECEFKMKFPQKGIYRITLSAGHIAGDGVQDDDQTEIMVSVINEKINILMIEGQPFWDSKFLSQALRKNPNINLTNIYRLSETRYFEVKTDESGASESEVPIFPDNIKDLAAFDIVIFGKGIEYFLNNKRINLLKVYLKDSGGALLLARAKPYSENLPGFETLEPVKWGEAVSREYRWEPTEAGTASGIFGDFLPGINNRIWNELPMLKYAYRCPELNSFSEVLAQGKVSSSSGAGSSFPVLISRKYGKGIVTALNSEGLWTWDFFPSGKGNGAFYGEFWLQLIHWMARHSDYLPGFNMALRLNKTSVLPGEPVTALISARDTASEKSDILINVFKNSQLIDSIKPVFDEDGSSGSAIIVPGKTGILTVELRYKENSKDMTLHSMLFVKRPPEEGDELSADPAFLKKICEDSGGRLIANDEIEFMKKEKDILPEQGNAVWIPLWDNWMLLCVIVFLAGAECFIRRRNGML